MAAKKKVQVEDHPVKIKSIVNGVEVERELDLTDSPRLMIPIEGEDDDEPEENFNPITGARIKNQKKDNNMTIKPPGWCENAVPVANQGWVDPVTDECYISSRFTQEQIDDFYGVPAAKELKKKPLETIKSMLKPDPMMHTHDNGMKHSHEGGDVDHTHGEDLDSMSKNELELLGREHGVELDRRKTKKSLVQTMKGILSKQSVKTLWMTNANI